MKEAAELLIGTVRISWSITSHSPFGSYEYVQVSLDDARKRTVL